MSSKEAESITVRGRDWGACWVKSGPISLLGSRCKVRLCEFFLLVSDIKLHGRRGPPCGVGQASRLFNRVREKERRRGREGRSRGAGQRRRGERRDERGGERGEERGEERRA